MSVARPVRLALLGLLAFLLAGPGASPRASAEEVWFGALEPPWRDQLRLPHNDYEAMFAPGAPWPRVLSHLNEVRFTKRFVQMAPDEMLRPIVAFLNGHHIAIAMQMTPLIHTRECGLGMEGYGPKDDMQKMAARLQSVGAVLDAVAMDEPLLYGHFVPSKGAATGCQLPIEEVARQTAFKVAQLRAVFPHLRVIDVEPNAPNMPIEEWLAALRDWFAAYRRATGEPLAMFEADMLWNRPHWQDNLVALADMLRAEHMPLGIIYNGTREEATDAAWTDRARRNFEIVEGTLGIKPALAAFLSWTPQPFQMLPETRPDTEAGLILSYLRYRGHEK